MSKTVTRADRGGVSIPASNAVTVTIWPVLASHNKEFVEEALGKAQSKENSWIEEIILAD